MLKISIVTPSFNQGHFLRETINSVVSQNYNNLEYIVIDGGSGDDSPKIIKEYDNSLYYWISEPDRGHAHALNKGFDKSTGEIMAWINSDDKYLPWTFATVNEIFTQHPDIEWIVGTNAWWNSKGTLLRARNVYKNRHDFLSGDFKWIQQESVFWRRSLWNRTGAFINEAYRLMVDGELWTRFFLEARLWHAECILSGYREHSSNRAKSHYDLCILEMESAIKQLQFNLKAVSSIETSKDYPLVIFDQHDDMWKKYSLSP